MVNRLHLITLIIGIFFLAQIPTHARMATHEDAPVEYLFYNRDITIKADGHTEDVVEYRLKILNEKGRNEAITMLTYNDSVSKIEILDARTINKGKEYRISKNMIENKPLASSTQAFDQQMQVMVSFPQATIGSELYIKYKTTTKKQPLPGYFALNLRFGEHGRWNQSRVNLTSEIPFHMKVLDPTSNLNVEQGQQDQKHTLSISLKKPLYEELIGAANPKIRESSHITMVMLSTCKDFNDLSKILAKNYEAVQQQPLPEEFQVIKRAAEKATSLGEKINIVTSILSERINYLGDWQTNEGRFSPRPLATVAKTGVGDCKDFSSATTAILRSMGIKAQIALVTRAYDYVACDNLPSLNVINHAIVKVTDAQGKIWWIDPTNSVSFSGGVFPDIANRPAYVLDKRNPTKEQIPPVDHRRARVHLENTISLKNGKEVNQSGTYWIAGEAAIPITATSLEVSRKSLEEEIVKMLVGSTDVRNLKIKLPPMNSRTVRDIQCQFSFDQNNILIPTTAGDAILIQSPWTFPFLAQTEDQTSGLCLGHPYTYTRVTTIHDTGTQNLESLNYHINLPWIRASRQCHAQGNSLQIIENVEILKSFITPKELKSQPYKDFKKLLQQTCKSFAVIMPNRG